MRKSIIIIASLLLLTCCGEDMGLIDVTLDFYPADKVPAGIFAWPHKTYIFSGNKCSKVMDTPSERELADLPVRKKSSISSLIVENAAAFDITPDNEGFAKDLLCIECLDHSSPAYFAQSESDVKDYTARMKTVPLTMAIGLDTKNSPDEMVSVSLTLKKAPRKLLLHSNEAIDNGSVVLSVRKGENREYHVLAYQADSLYLGFVRRDGSSIEVAVAAPKGMCPGAEIGLDFDYSRYETESIIVLNCSVDGKESTSEEIKCLLPKLNRHYEVYVYRNDAWEYLDVHDALVSDASKHYFQWKDWDNSLHYRDTMSFCLFTDSFDNPVKIRVKKKASWSNVIIRPNPYGITPKDCGDGVIEFEIPSYEKRRISIEFDGDRYHNLFLLGNKPDLDAPKPGDPGVIYYGPGEHNPSNVNVGPGQTLYVAEGAILYSKVRITGSGAKIAGRGIISGERLKHWGDDQYSWGDILVDINNGKSFYDNVTIEGVTFIDSPAWCLRMLRCTNSRIENINMIHWILNGDGIDICNSDNIEIKDCFLRAYDDCISLKSIYEEGIKVHDIKISDCTIWADLARGIVVGPESGNTACSDGGITDVVVDNCIFLEHASYTSGSNVRAALSVMQFRNWDNYGSAFPIRDITFKNLYFDDLNPAGTHIYVYQSSSQDTGSQISNIRFENIQVNYKRKPSRAVFTLETGQNNNLQGLNFKNFTINGERVLSAGDQFKISGNASEVQFE
ncbi:MAG: hypothetical protein HUJ94_01860 [Bacteroidales bacterium]|nr:hypothetical protein [Bacteroidales bacterium]